MIAQWDPRLSGTAPKANLAKVYNLTGGPLKVDSVDAGWLEPAGVGGRSAAALRSARPSLADPLRRPVTAGRHRRTYATGRRTLQLCRQ
ncbi:hypothetical protein [Pseudomonas sp. GM79]|uniref:hypothetical protein n=1 Tax=Pseudomonas sp. GM79 TaxID=1144338 RepID=UPI0002FBAD87|nr:hypothetical protein [Pseudomonas sp. GM79]